MKLPFANEAKSILKKLEKNGYLAYIVGGTVRDMILHKKYHEYDIATNAKPETVMKLFNEYYIDLKGIKYGSVILISSDSKFEITTFRKEGKYSDFRHPDVVQFADTLEEDLMRRDFTMNSLALSSDGNVIDLYNGYNDIKAGIIKCIGEPSLRFSEDPLRIMRAIRFSSVLNFKIEKETKNEIFKKADLLNRISVERFKSEFFLILNSKGATETLLEYKNVFAKVIPEFSSMFDFNQHSPYHLYDVWEHSVRAASCIDSDTYLKLTLLLHDIGKPKVFRLDEFQRGHFPSHATTSAEIAENILFRLNISKKDISFIKKLIFHHMDDLEDKINIRTLMVSFGKEDFPKFLDVLYADNYAHGMITSKKRLENIIKAEKYFEENKASFCFSKSNLNISANDLIDLSIEKSFLSSVINKLFHAVIYETCENSKESLIKYAKNIINTEKQR